MRKFLWVSLISFCAIADLSAKDLDSSGFHTCERMLSALGIEMMPVGDLIVSPTLNWDHPKELVYVKGSSSGLRPHWTINSDLTGAQFGFLDPLKASDVDSPKIFFKFRQNREDPNTLTMRLLRNEMGSFYDVELLGVVLSYLHERLDRSETITTFINDPDMVRELNSEVEVDGISMSLQPGRIDPYSEAFINIGAGGLNRNYVENAFRSANLKRKLNEAWQKLPWAKIIASAGWNSKIEIVISGDGIFYEDPSEPGSFTSFDDYLSNQGGEVLGSQLQNLLIFRYRIILEP